MKTQHLVKVVIILFSYILEFLTHILFRLLFATLMIIVLCFNYLLTLITQIC